MKYLSHLLLTAAAVTLLLAIWQPVGTWWQWSITALVLFLAGAGTGAATDKPNHPIDGPELLPEHVAREFVPPTTLEQVDKDVAEYKRREYGRKADDQ